MKASIINSLDEWRWVVWKLPPQQQNNISFMHDFIKSGKTMMMMMATPMNE